MGHFFTSSFSPESFPGGKISICMNFVVGDFNKQMQKLNINNCQPCSVYTNSRDLSILLKWETLTGGSFSAPSNLGFHSPTQLLSFTNGKSLIKRKLAASFLFSHNGSGLLLSSNLSVSWDFLALSFILLQKSPGKS